MLKAEKIHGNFVFVSDVPFLRGFYEPHYLGRHYYYDNHYCAWLLETNSTSSNNSAWLLGYTGSPLRQFSCVCDLAQERDQGVEAIDLPPSYQCNGTGHVVLDELLYCHQGDREEYNEVIVYDLNSRSLVAIQAFPDAGDYLFGHYIIGYMKVAFDGENLWVMYGSKANDGYLTLVKVIPRFLIPIEQHVTQVRVEDMAHAIIINSILYTTLGHETTSTYINYVYNTFSQRGTFLSADEYIRIGNPNTVYMMNYNPRLGAVTTQIWVRRVYTHNVHMAPCDI
jgi:hypothetical protein